MQNLINVVVQNLNANFDDFELKLHVLPRDGDLFEIHRSFISDNFFSYHGDAATPSKDGYLQFEVRYVCHRVSPSGEHRIELTVGFPGEE
ncbi:hypothetical protein [Burkholderia ubonensis]|uniref:hypothetical protein n=1 Tax=Burkholderia ubonensis TaxID=101571 RepID=UPI00075E1E20|nr:hypothetical protein [Burkholderia ubonensis]